MGEGGGALLVGADLVPNALRGPEPRVRPSGFREVADVAAEQFDHPLSDHISRLNAFMAYYHLAEREGNRMEPERLKMWTNDHMLSFEGLREATRIYHNMGELAASAGLGASSLPVTDNRYAVMKALAVGHCTQLAILGGNGVYRTVHDNVSALLDPTSVLVETLPVWVVFDKVRYSGKPYLSVVTAVSAEWLVVRISHRRPGVDRQLTSPAGSQDESLYAQRHEPPAQVRQLGLRHAGRQAVPRSGQGQYRRARRGGRGRRADVRVDEAGIARGRKQGFSSGPRVSRCFTSSQHEPKHTERDLCAAGLLRPSLMVLVIAS